MEGSFGNFKLYEQFDRFSCFLEVNSPLKQVKLMRKLHFYN